MASIDLFEDNQNLVYSIVHKYFKIPYLIDDITQCGMMGLHIATQTFDKNKGFKFSTYAYVCIRNEIITFLKKNLNKNTLYSLDECIIDESIEESTMESIELISHLNKKEREIAILKMNGLTYKEIGERFNCSKQRVEAIMRKIRKQCRHLQEY